MATRDNGGGSGNDSCSKSGGSGCVDGGSGDDEGSNNSGCVVAGIVVAVVTAIATAVFHQNPQKHDL
jgi:hypothetical protein